MTMDELNHLRAGDVIRGVVSGLTYVVLLGSDGGRPGSVIATRTLAVTSPDEWEVVAITGQRERA